MLASSPGRLEGEGGGERPGIYCLRMHQISSYSVRILISKSFCYSAGLTGLRN